ncbi:hypothetical protein VSU19_17950 [Verrucomicrobiales bacterium BCK34]|nr:hypothetical protein [Verrucomicrobiales bacterium BCK34]
MNRLLLLISGFLAVSLLASGCAFSKKEDTLEGAMQKQDAWLEKQIQKSERRGASFDEKWENYTKKQDEKYHAWMNKVMDD